MVTIEIKLKCLVETSILYFDFHVLKDGPFTCSMLRQHIWTLLSKYCAIYRYKKLFTTSNILILSLSVADFTAGLSTPVLSHSFICLPLSYVEGIVLICNIDLYCVIAIFNGTGDMFNR